MSKEFKVRIKVSALRLYEFTNLGYIKACDMFKDLMNDPHIEKKTSNVTESIENLTYDGRDIIRAEYDALLNEVVLYLDI